MRYLASLGRAAALLLASSGVVVAQESDIARQAFNYTGTGLTIDVQADAPGVLRIVRGQRGRVEVASRVPGGFATSGMTQRGGDKLKLSAIGAQRVEYLVVVPEETRVQVRLPDRPLAEVFGSMQDMASYSWKPPAAGSGGAAEGVSEPGSTRQASSFAADAMQLVFAASSAPSRLVIPSASSVRKVSVRVEGDRFRVEANRSLSLSPGSAAVLEIRPTMPELDLVVTVPLGTSAFLLQVGGDNALAITNGRASALCSPVTALELAGGRRSFTFNPDEGRMSCGARVGSDPSRRAS